MQCMFYLQSHLTANTRPGEPTTPWPPSRCAASSAPHPSSTTRRRSPHLNFPLLPLTPSPPSFLHLIPHQILLRVITLANFTLSASPSPPQPVSYNCYYGITGSLAASRLQRQQRIAGDNAQLQRRCATTATVSQCKKNPLSCFVHPPLADPRLPFSCVRTLPRSSSARARTPSQSLHTSMAAVASSRLRPSSAVAAADSSRRQSSGVASGDKPAARARPASAGA